MSTELKEAAKRFDESFDGLASSLDELIMAAGQEGTEVFLRAFYAAGVFRGVACRLDAEDERPLVVDRDEVTDEYA